MKKPHDFLKPVLALNILATLLAVVTATIVSWANSASRNLALATGTLAATAAAFLIQLLFELQGSKTADHVGTEFTIDLLGPSIRQWNYDATPAWRMGAEIGASNWLVANSPGAFQSDREMLRSDFAVFCLLSFLTTQEFDWQLRRIAYSSQTFGSVFQTEAVSEDWECSAFTENDLRAELTKSGNMFAGAPLRCVTGKLRLPPGSTIEIARKYIVIENPVCRISWKLEEKPFFSSSVQPRTGGEVPQLASGQARYESAVKGFKIEVNYFRLHSQRHDIAKYRDWISRMLADVHEWFEARPPSQ